MRYALNLADDGRILSVTYEAFANNNMPIVDSLPEGDVSDYKYVGGEFVYDPQPELEQENKPSVRTDAERIADLEELVKKLLSQEG